MTLVLFGYDPATMTLTDLLGIVGAGLAVILIVLALAVVAILICGPRRGPR